MPINYKNYALNWKEISEHIRFVRAKNKCETCGAVNYQPHPITGSKVILTVAHLDHNIKNNDLANLKALCQKCHNSYDAKQRAMNRKNKAINHGS